MEEIFSFGAGFNLEISRPSWRSSSRLEDVRQEEIIEKSSGEIIIEVC